MFKFVSKFLKMKSLFFLVGFLYSFISIAQIPIVYNHSADGKAILGNYHTYLEKEYKNIRIPLESEFDKLEKGYYKLVNDSKIRKAYIDFNSKKITVREDKVESPKKQKIKISEVEYLKLGVDSFFVINKIRDQKIVSQEQRLVKHIASFDSIVYAQCFNYTYNGILKDKFFIEKNTKIESTWERVVLEGEPLKRNFFMSVGKLNRFIEKKEITEEEFLKSVKELQYLNKLKNDERFYYSKTWQPLKNKKDAFYSSKVVAKKDSIYSVVYYDKNQVKLYNVNYSSFNPNIKTGALNIYNNGVLSEKRIYSDDTLKSLSKYLKNGELNFKYNCSKTSKNKLSKAVFSTITTKEDEIINSPINGTFSIKETGKNIKYVFKNNKIINSYYEIDDNKYYFFNDDNNVITDRLKNGLIQFLELYNGFNIVKFENNLEGTILLDITTDRKGKAVSYKILNKLNNRLDQLLENFCINKLSEKADFKIRFKGIKLAEKDAYCRFVIPIIFSHNRFHETFIRPSNYYYNDFFFHNLWQQQQQQQLFQQQQIKLPTFNTF